MTWCVVAAGVAFATAGIAAWWNRRVRGFLPDDLPRAGRKQHARPVPLAGIVLVPAVAWWLVAAERWWLLGAMGLAAGTGFVDDWRKERGDGLDWRWKAAGLFAASAAGIAAFVSAGAPWWLLASALLFVFVVTNATNFLDNTDGVACALAATSLIVLGGASDEYAAVGFAALGFLPWNWPRARLFLGDSGAYALGLATGVAAVDRCFGTSHATPLFAVTVQLVDFVQVVMARLVIGHPPWVGDRRHLTHVVQNLGVPARWIAPLFAAIALTFALVGRTMR